MTITPTRSSRTAIVGLIAVFPIATRPLPSHTNASAARGGFDGNASHILLRKLYTIMLQWRVNALGFVLETRHISTSDEIVIQRIVTQQKNHRLGIYSSAE
ncbi:hypothetical protein L210DRAFT_3541285 [Boletus edulis BED1]|uniref:Uncharacterized protein n=1 Tax=Boletus edulis BED1 TaxID=1328754 RepID=A0AAD4BUG7_BOLED|nr:hypothetical protein L210DRAFT_3541285 [Boletus edulis BED1]